MPIELLEAIYSRRSYGRLSEPAPSEADLQRILEAGASAPDHGELRPFRFVLLSGQGLNEFGTILEQAYRHRCAASGREPIQGKVDKERTKLQRAPLVIVVGAVRTPDSHIPWTDQRDAAVAAAQNILLATHALGYGAMWRTGEPCQDSFVKAALGFSADDAVVAFLYVGTPQQLKPPRQRRLEGLISEFRLSPTP